MSVEAEQNLIASALISDEHISKLLELPEDWFTQNSHKLIVRTIRELTSQSLSADFFAIGDELNRKGQLETAGGMPYLVELSESLPTLRFWDSYKRSLFDKYKLGQINVLNQNISMQLQSGGKPADIIESMQESLIGLLTDHHNGGFARLETFFDGVLDEMEWREKHPGEYLGQSFGYKELDETTDGAQDQTVIVIAGRPGSGKTALALKLAKNLSSKDKHWFAFSLEMSGKSLAKRALVTESKVFNTKFKSGKLNEGDYAAIAGGITRLQGVNLHIDPTPSLPIEKMRSRLKAAQVKHGDIGGIMIDHIGLIGKPKGKQDTEAMNAIADSLLELAKEFDCPVIELCQLNRGTEGRADRRPMMSDLKQSGKIEENADMIFLLYRGDYYDANEPAITELNIAKNRDGETKTIYYDHNMALGEYHEILGYEPPAVNKKGKL